MVKLKYCLFFLVAHAFCPASHAALYVGEDEKGIIHFSDNPVPGVKQHWGQNINEDTYINLPSAKDTLLKELPNIFCSYALDKDMTRFVKNFGDYDGCLTKTTPIHKVCLNLVIRKYPETIRNTQVNEFFSDIEACSWANIEN